jgi:hypothetical protein
MSKQPTRLADFQITREQTERPAEPLAHPSAADLDGVPATPQITQSGAAPAAMPVVQSVPAMAEHTVVATAAAAGAVLPSPMPGALAAQPPVSPAASPTSPMVLAPIPLPVSETRKQVGARIRVSVAERLRAYQFYSREEQQDIVERALDEFLRGKGF